MERYRKVRAQTEAICAFLEDEDCVVQTHGFVSPPKWHLGHTTWLFETFLLRRLFDERPHDPRFHFVFNSYYESQGERVDRSMRGTLSRPTLKEVRAYRKAIDERMEKAAARMAGNDIKDLVDEWEKTLELGIHHEQQHQELLFMDLKSVLFHQPDHPAYRGCRPRETKAASKGWVEIEAGLHDIGDLGESFAFDNERPRHRVFLEDFAISQALVSNGDFLDFMVDRGYERPELWLSDGWDWVQNSRMRHPRAWVSAESEWLEFTLEGLKALDPSAPICHVSFFEADAYARWKGLRLPTEAEWEIAARKNDGEGQFWQGGPVDAGAENTSSLTGSLWQWTASAYRPYPGYRPFDGGFAEYNGKFMNGQMILRGGCFATASGHIRPTYRNFFQPEMTWQFSGIRLAR